MKRSLGVTVGTVLVLYMVMCSECRAQTVALARNSGAAVDSSRVAPGHKGPMFGEVRGLARDASATALSEVRVTLHSVSEKTDRTVFSGSDGVFVVQNLVPGVYRVVADKEGFTASAAQTVRVDAGASLQDDITLTAANAARSAATPPAASGDAPLTQREQQLLDRIDRLEQRLALMESRQVQGGSPSAAANPAAAASLNAPAVLPAAKPQELASIAPAAAAPAVKPSAATPPSAISTATSSAAVNPAPAASGVAEGWMAPAQSTEKSAKVEPFSDADWSWLNGNPRTKDIYWDTKFFTPEIRADVTGTWDNQHPTDHSMGGSSELFRSGEVQLEQLGIGGDFHWDNVRARFMTQFGAYSTATIRNDGSYTHGEWDVSDADRYLSEAYGGYHFNVLNGINVDAGIFMSYIGLFSYYNFDNWAYQPSYVSSNTPWFFQGVRIQIFPTPHLKIEPWFINGWQSYGSSNNRPGLGGQLKWTPFPWMNVISNEYGLGHDDLYTPGRARIHTDNSLEVKYYDKPTYRGLDKMAFTFTGDLGCEYGGGVSCTGDHAGGPKQSFVGAMLYNRFWFDKDQFAITLGGGAINNPGRYLVLLPPINGETAGSAAINSPYFTENPGDPFKAWDSSFTFDWMPKQYITFRIEPDYRHANVPYWSGRGGITPPAYAGTPATVVNGNGYPTEYACMSGAPSGTTILSSAEAACGGGLSSVWFPNLVKSEFLVDFDIMVKF